MRLVRGKHVRSDALPIDGPQQRVVKPSPAQGQLTLNHILLVDWYYLDGLEKGGRGLSIFDSKVPFPRLPDLAVAQRAADARLVRYCDCLTEEDWKGW